MRSISDTFVQLLFLGATLLFLSACQTAALERQTFSNEAVEQEGLQQEAAVIRLRHSRFMRINNIAYPLLVANTDLCGPDWTANNFGIILHSLDSYDQDDYDVYKEEFSLGYRPTILGIIEGSPADLAGFKAGDDLMIYMDQQVVSRKGALDDLMQTLEGVTISEHMQYLFLATRGEEGISAELSPVSQCSFPILLEESPDLNAYADGANIFFTSTILNTLNDDQLRIIAGHEMAHNIMSHVEKTAENVNAARAAGFLADLAFAVLGVNTGGYFNKAAGQAAHQAYSQDFEAEADVVGLYILARAGYSFHNASQLWRDFSALAGGGSIYEGGSHPPTAERYLALQRTADDIQRQVDRDEEPWPPMPADWKPREGWDEDSQTVEDVNRDDQR